MEKQVRGVVNAVVTDETLSGWGGDSRLIYDTVCALTTSLVITLNHPRHLPRRDLPLECFADQQRHYLGSSLQSLQPPQAERRY